jgi:hypothetical protein
LSFLSTSWIEQNVTSKCFIIDMKHFHQSEHLPKWCSTFDNICQSGIWEECWLTFVKVSWKTDWWRNDSGCMFTSTELLLFPDFRSGDGRVQLSGETVNWWIWRDVWFLILWLFRIATAEWSRECWSIETQSW